MDAGGKICDIKEGELLSTVRSIATGSGELGLSGEMVSTDDEGNVDPAVYGEKPDAHIALVEEGWEQARQAGSRTTGSGSGRERACGAWSLHTAGRQPKHGARVCVLFSALEMIPKPNPSLDLE